MDFFIAVAIVAIVAGGVISAFSARRPSRFVMWLTAYLVLVVGIVQIGLVFSYRLMNLPTEWPIALGFILFNLGNLAVMFGRWLKGRSSRARFIVYTGGILLAIAMIIMGGLAFTVSFSWTQVLFLSLVIIILVSMPIGLILSAKPHKS